MSSLIIMSKHPPKTDDLNANASVQFHRVDSMHNIKYSLCSGSDDGYHEEFPVPVYDTLEPIYGEGSQLQEAQIRFEKLKSKFLAIFCQPPQVFARSPGWIVASLRRSSMETCFYLNPKLLIIWYQMPHQYAASEYNMFWYQMDQILKAAGKDAD
ncbi:hypothetical protein K1719_009711 [Acacia pycnantha]|nr:hypothetical protein K1719_009711 [Acacia pycnantha]